MGRLADVPLTLVETFSDLEELWRWLGNRRKVLAVDVETTGFSVAHDRIRLAQLGDTTRGWAIPWERYAGVVIEALERYDRPIVAHHAKFDASFLIRHGRIRWPWERTHDTLTMCALVDSLGPKSLKAAASLHVDRDARQGQKELRDTMTRNGWTWATVPIEWDGYWGYAAGDTVMTAMLAEELWDQVQPYRAAYDLEMSASRVLCGMELRGVRIDVDYCQTQKDDLERRLAKLLDELSPLNPFAPHQVSAALQNLGVELTKRTKAGKVAVDDEVLRGSGSELARLVLEARDTQKLVSAFFGNFLRFRSGDILHPRFNQLAARTHRMSVSEPALQQVPKQALVRDAFIPREGNRLVVADYDSEEMRLAAHFSRDQEMIRKLREGLDPHADTARRVYNVDEPTKAQRDVGKRAMFARLYGAGVPKFARTVGMPESEAAQVFNVLAELYPGMAQGMAYATRAVRDRAAGGRNGWVQLPDGRRLSVPVEQAYKGLNAAIQGTGASVMKQALVDLDRAGLGDYLTMSVHDSVLLDSPERDAAELIQVCEQVMRRNDFAVPLTVSSKALDRWGSELRDDG